MLLQPLTTVVIVVTRHIIVIGQIRPMSLQFGRGQKIRLNKLTKVNKFDQKMLVFRHKIFFVKKKLTDIM